MSKFSTIAQAALIPQYAIFGESATYTRGEYSVAVTVIRVDLDVETEDADGVFRRSVTRVFW